MVVQAYRLESSLAVSPRIVTDPAEQPCDLFQEASRAGPTRVADAASVEQFAGEQLKTIFSFVSEPIPIPTHRKLRQFSLFLLSGNPNERAIALIRRGLTAQVKKYAGRTRGEKRPSTDTDRPRSRYNTRSILQPFARWVDRAMLSIACV